MPTNDNAAIAALSNPAPMHTPAGVEMSPRARAVYRYVQNRGIQLTPFSTDSQVAGKLSELGEARKHLQQNIEECADGDAKVALVNVLADLETIMRRVPGARFPTAQKQKTTIQQISVAALKEVASSGFIAVGEGQAAGCQLWWEGGRDSNVDALCAELTRLGVPEKMHPGEMTLARALRRAMAQAVRGTGDRIYVRPIARNVEWAIVREWIDEAKLPRTEPILVATMEGETISFRDVTDEGERFVEPVRAALTGGAGRITRQQISGWLSSRLIDHLEGFALRASGSIYYVPPHTEKAVRELAKYLRAACGFTFSFTPVVKCEDVLDTVLRGVQMHADAVIAKIEEDLLKNSTMGVRALRTKDTQAADTKALLAGYEQMLGVPLAHLHGKLETTRLKLAGMMVEAAAGREAEEPAQDAAEKRMALVVAEDAKEAAPVHPILGSAVEMAAPLTSQVQTAMIELADGTMAPKERVDAFLAPARAALGIQETAKALAPADSTFGRHVAKLGAGMGFFRYFGVICEGGQEKLRIAAEEAHAAKLETARAAERARLLAAGWGIPDGEDTGPVRPVDLD